MNFLFKQLQYRSLLRRDDNILIVKREGKNTIPTASYSSPLQNHHDDCHPDRREGFVFAKSKNSFYLLIILVFFQISCVHFKNKTEPTFNDSLSLLNHQLKENPTNIDALFHRATWYNNNKQTDSALVDLSKIISIDTSNANVYCMLADIYFTKGNFNACEHAINKTLFIQPNHIGALTRKAEINFYLKDYNACFTLAKKTLKLDNHNPRLYFILAMAYKETGDTSKAIQNFQQVIMQDVNYIEAYIQLGLLFVGKQNIALAEGNLKNALQLQPNNIEALYALGLLYQDNNKPEQAIEQYNQILKIAPQNKYAYYNIGYIKLIVFKTPTKALSLFTKATEFDNTFAEAWYNKGYCNELLQNIPQAKLDYKKAITCRPNYTKAIEALNHLK